MKIELKPGEHVMIHFEDTDGEITVSFGDKDNASVSLPAGIVVHADLPDERGREGIIYHEPFSDEPGMVGALSVGEEIKALVDAYAWNGSYFPIADCFANLKQHVAEQNHHELKEAIRKHAEEYNKTLE